MGSCCTKKKAGQCRTDKVHSRPTTMDSYSRKNIVWSSTDELASRPTTMDQDSYLCCTVCGNDLERAQYLLWKKKSDPDATCEIHHTSALYMACENQQLDFVEMLIANEGKPANVNRYSNNAYSYDLNALCIAVKSRNLALVHLLLDKAIIRPDLEHRSKCQQSRRVRKCTALSRAAYLGDIPIARALIGAGADINSRKDSYYMPLRMAIIADNLEMCQFLLDKGCYVNLTKRGSTVVDYASSVAIRNSKCQDNPYEVVKLLLQHGADPCIAMLASKRNYWGKNLEPFGPIQNVCSKDEAQLLDVFIQYGYINMTPELMFYAMDIARAENCCVSLLEWGFNVYYCLFYRAAREGCFGFMRVLIDLDPRYLRKSCLREYPSKFANFQHRSGLSEFQAWLQEHLLYQNRPLLLAQMCRMKILQQLRHKATLTHTRIPDLIQQLPLSTMMKSLIGIPSISQVLE